MVRATWPMRIAVVGALTGAVFSCDPDEDAGGRADAGPPNLAVSILALGHSSACVLRQDGDMYCWGSVDEVPGASVSQSSPVKIAALSGAGVRGVGLGDGSGCTVHADGTARCWGYNGWGQLGDGSTTDHREPELVASLTDAVAIETSGLHACARVKSNDLKCWGRNSQRQVVDDTARMHSVPVDSRQRDVRAFGVADGYSCAVSAGGRPTCWGDPEAGALRTGTLDDVVRISLGQRTACAVRSDGNVHCWGSNFDGVVAPEGVGRAQTPERVRGLTDVVDVRLASSSACALHRNGTVSCWGSPMGTLLESWSLALPPTLVPDIDSAVSLALGFAHACVVTRDDRILCWGPTRPAS